jgi:hypothetical protein
VWRTALQLLLSQLCKAGLLLLLQAAAKHMSSTNQHRCLLEIGRQSVLLVLLLFSSLLAQAALV